MDTRKNKANPNMARSKKACIKAAKKRWAQYRHEKSLLLSAYPNGIPAMDEEIPKIVVAHSAKD